MIAQGHRCCDGRSTLQELTRRRACAFWSVDRVGNATLAEWPLPWFGRHRRAGFSLIELLVVIRIAAVLIALLLPAVQNAREAARRTQCRNQLRQVAVGLHNFHSQYAKFPGNGWRFAWVGEPGRAAGMSQPGGWIYQVLPQVEQANLWQLGSDTSDESRRVALSQLCRTRLPQFKCPSRPCEQMGPPSTKFQYRNADPPPHVARTDYAINEGDFITATPGGPPDLAAGDDKTYPWKDVSQATGVSWLRGGARMQDITDGASNVYLADEKYMSLTGYT